MAKKFVIQDDDGQQFEVTEETVDEEPEEEKPEVHDDESLTADEIAALKSLAAKASDILKLLDVKAKDDDEDVDEDMTKDEDEDEDVINDDGEDVDEDMTKDEDEDKETVVKTGDSKKSIGSIQRKRVVANDSIENREIDIAKAWADRYNKSYKKGE